MKNLDYGVIGNCRSAALISKKGSIDWLCLPDFDSPSVFAKILDKNKGGYLSIEVDKTYKIHQEYLRWTNILCTKFISQQGSFEVIDFMPRYKTSDNDYFTPSELYRFIRYISGTPILKIKYFPMMNYAIDPVENVVLEDYIRTFSKVNPTNCIYLYSDIDYNDIIESNEILLTGDKFMLLSYNQKIVTIDINRVYLEYQRTKVYWLNWANRSRKYDKYMDQIIRSLLVLKTMSFQFSGAMLAALTTSIPETIGEVRNWDYRFCWLRDASMSIETLLDMGHESAAERFINYIHGILRSKADEFQIMYGIRGEKDLVETGLPHLDGYENSKPVRIGNDAYRQRQNDVFGYLVNVIYQYYEYFPGTLDEVEDMWEIVRNIIRTVSTHWENPDKGIWEIRNNEEHFVFSKVMSWVAVDRATKIAAMLNKNYYVETWTGIANDIREDVMMHGWNEELQTFTQTYSNTHMDASLLLMAEYGFIDGDDIRFKKTVLAIKETLFHDGLMYRYKNHDDFGLPTSSFTICTFWLIQALVTIGMKKEATMIFEKLLSYSNHVGLFSEDIDFKTKRLLGNFPQAYSHLALIQTATLLGNEKTMSKFIKP